MVSNPVGDLVVRVSIAFGVTDTIAVALRLLARTRSKASLGADDALITASLIPLYGMVVIGYLSQWTGLRGAEGFADLIRRCSGWNGVDDRGERRVRAWNITNLNAPETYDVGPGDSRTLIMYNQTLDANKSNLVYAYNNYCQNFDSGPLPSNILHHRF